MSNTIIYANFTNIEKYLSEGQINYLRDHVEDINTDLFPVTRHFIHNDGPDMRVVFTINMAGAQVLTDMPIDVFNRLPRYTPTPEEMARAHEAVSKGTKTGRTKQTANVPATEEAADAEN